MNNLDDCRFQTDPIIAELAKKDPVVAKVIQEYMRVFQGSIDLNCFICGEPLKETFKFNIDTLSIIRGDGKCTRCGLPYVLYHFLPIPTHGLYLRIEYFYNSWKGEQLGKMRKMWALADYNKSEFWRNVCLAFPLSEAEGEEPVANE